VRSPRALRVLFVAIAVAVPVALVGAPGAPPAAAEASARWQPPVEGRATRGFDAPAHRFGPGHRGVDYSAPPGSAVRAAGDGVVAYAGVVAGSVHVVVAHATGLRTSYSYLQDTTVHRGETVARGAVVGHAGGTGDHHEGSVVHFGLRVGDDYVDPLVLFRPVDLGAVVHLAPHHDPVLESAAEERRSLLGTIGRAIGAVVGAGAGAVDAAFDAVARLERSALAGLVRLADRGLAHVDAIVARLDALGIDLPYVEAYQVARRLVSWAASRLDCDPHARRADGTGGSGNRVMLVGGINSAPDDLDRTADRLGYDDNEIERFSYRPGSASYDHDDTHHPLEVSARALRDQLRAAQREHPGEPVDLLAHSQGGVVALTFVLLFYDQDDPTLPPIDNLVTLSSPLQGAPLASLASVLTTTPAGRAALERVGFGRDSVRDLAEGSDVVRRILTAKLPASIDLATIGSALDWAVPADHAHLPGATQFDVAPITARAHDDIVGNARAQQAVLAVLEDRPLPCLSLREGVTAAVAPVAISYVESLAGAVPNRTN
jgi:hypothetical protein